MKKLTFIFSVLLIIFGCLFFLINIPSKYILEGSASLNNGKVAKAVRILEEGLQKYPDNHKIVLLLAKGYLLSGETNKANKIVVLKTIPKKFKQRKDFLDLFVDLAESNKKNKNEKFAKIFGYEYLKRQNPSEVSKRVVRNYIRIGQVIPEQSVKVWEKAFNVASTLKNTELKESIKALLLPKYFSIVQIFKLNKEYEKALEVLQKARILGKNAKINFEEALIYSELNQIDLARKQYENAIRLDPGNVDYKIHYANLLKNEAFKTKDEDKRKVYSEKIKLLLSSVYNDPRKANILNKIINLNVKYKVTSDLLKVTKVGDYFYPFLSFKIQFVSDTPLKNYKIVFLGKDKNQLDVYESSLLESDINRLIEVTCKNSVNEYDYINAKLFLNNEFVKEWIKD